LHDHPVHFFYVHGAKVMCFSIGCMQQYVTCWFTKGKNYLTQFVTC
jgi:hypothetical protein